jgi:hypothetical protein
MLVFGNHAAIWTANPQSAIELQQLILLGFLWAEIKKDPA